MLATRYGALACRIALAVLDHLSQDVGPVQGPPVEDRAAEVYGVEFLRAYESWWSVALAHRVAVAQVAMEFPQMAGAAFLLPGLVNGYGRIEKRPGGIEDSLEMLEWKLDRLCGDGEC